MQRDSIGNIFKVSILLCLACSIVVSALAVGLKPIQEQKKKEFRQQSVLEAAGLWEETDDIESLFKSRITPVVVDLETNEPTDTFAPDAKELDATVATRKPKLHDDIPQSEDIAGIRKREKYSLIYAVGEAGNYQTLVLPIRGYGLWSTLWGYLALDVSEFDGNPESIKVAGITYYKHGETPGLGGEVETALFKEQWPGKRVFSDDWQVRLKMAKSAAGEYQVDSISGATLTSNGVSNMLDYWLGENGFGPFLQKTLSPE